MQSGMSKADKEKAFFEGMAKQKNDAEESRVAAMGEEERERYMAAKAVSQRRCASVGFAICGIRHLLGGYQRRKIMLV